MISFCSKINTFFSGVSINGAKRTENKVQTIARFLHLLRGVILKIFLKFSSDCRLAVCLIFFHSSSGCRLAICVILFHSSSDCHLDCSLSFVFVVNVSLICRSKSFNGLLPTASFLHLQIYKKKSKEQGQFCSCSMQILNQLPFVSIKR